MTTLLDLRDMGKRFGQSWALRHVDFSLEAGEIHALVGENGAGKSTLIKLVAGVHRPDEGTMAGPGGATLTLHTPRDALLAGIGVVHQELDLFDNMTVAQNIALSPQRRGFLQPAAARMREAAVAALKTLGVAIDPDAKVGRLSTSDKQMVAIAKALSWQARILIFDEPTSALNSEDAASLIAVIRRLRAEGIGIVYISHKFAEVFALADRVTVLRDGARIGTWPTSALTHESIVTAMLGRPAREMFPAARPAPANDLVCRLEGVEGRLLRGASLGIRRGEVLALAGLPDAGASSVLRTLFGLERHVRGTIAIDGVPFRRPTPIGAIRRGLAYLPADRLRDGLLPLMDVLRNVEAVAEAQRLEAAKPRRAHALEAIRRLSVRAASLGQRIPSLSGGNQQKALIARWLVARPTLLMLDDPTRGIDVGAKTEIYHLLRTIAEAGTTVVYTSSESLELAQLADRILVFRGGRVAEEIHGRVEHEALDRIIAAA